MATVPTGPSSALPASPAEITSLPGGRSVEPGGEGESVGGKEDSFTAGTGKESQVTEVNRSIKKKQKNMLSHANPAALRLKMQPQEQQQLNGLVSPSEEADSHQYTENRSDNPRPSFENCDSNSEGTLSDNNKGEHCQHEGHSPFSKNSSHPLLNNNSMNGMLSITRTEAVQNHPETADHADNEWNEDCNPTEPPRPPGEPPDHDPLESTKPGGAAYLDPSQQPPVTELARLDLKGSFGKVGEESHGIHYVRYESELQMPWIMRLITKDLSEPYSIYTYRYFIHNWPQLCFLAMVEQECVGAIVCKLDMHKKMFRRGYIAMLAVDSKHRRKSIGTNLVKKAIYAMVEGDCDEVVLETEITNKSALKLYENLGFVRDKRLFRYYLNGVDALRLKLWLR
ncbi:N-alpha-acetyltransferase 30 [Lampris incognitus]|uniref:N-alpha-acetyltransferase 30 n=1 Tax=Lampris incognitus TaxID=2546036 RepID=UPI0024B538FB|nr:N-alpha-acetyltransferase 30 [Lampris incognitus]